MNDDTNELFAKIEAVWGEELAEPLKLAFASLTPDSTPPPTPANVDAEAQAQSDEEPPTDPLTEMVGPELSDTIRSEIVGASNDMRSQYTTRYPQLRDDGVFSEVTQEVARLRRENWAPAESTTIGEVRGDHQRQLFDAACRSICFNEVPGGGDDDIIALDAIRAGEDPQQALDHARLARETSAELGRGEFQPTPGGRQAQQENDILDAIVDGDHAQLEQLTGRRRERRYRGGP